mgnify:CR=1 FL=1
MLCHAHTCSKFSLRPPSSAVPPWLAWAGLALTIHTHAIAQIQSTSDPDPRRWTMARSVRPPVLIVEHRRAHSVASPFVSATRASSSNLFNNRTFQLGGGSQSTSCSLAASVAHGALPGTTIVAIFHYWQLLTNPEPASTMLQLTALTDAVQVSNAQLAAVTMISELHQRVNRQTSGPSCPSSRWMGRDEK